MAAAFAALETRLNRAVFSRLANVDAVVNSVAVPAIFDAAYAQGSVGAYGMASSQPVLTLATADVPATPVGAAVVVGAASYLVAEHQPDGTGISRLLLEAAA
jgi:hypothetical protein